MKKHSFPSLSAASRIRLGVDDWANSDPGASNDVGTGDADSEAFYLRKLRQQALQQLYAEESAHANANPSTSATGGDASQAAGGDGVRSESALASHAAAQAAAQAAEAEEQLRSFWASTVRCAQELV